MSLNPWMSLIIAGSLEVGFASTLKLTENFTRPLPTVIFLLCITGSFVFLERAAQTIPIGTAYAVWTGIGAVGTAVIGLVVYKEPANFGRLFFLATLVGSIVGLKLTAHP